MRKNIFIFIAGSAALFLLVILSFAQENPVVENNLFSPTRTPFSPKLKPPQTPSQTNISDLQLDGIMFLDKEKRAIFKINPNVAPDKKAGKTCITLKEGESIGPYKVVAVEKTQVLIEEGSNQYTLKLVKPGKPMPPMSVSLPSVQPAPQKQSQPTQPALPHEQNLSPEGSQQEANVGSAVMPPQQPTPQENVPLPIPSPEEFEKLNPDERQEVMEKINEAMANKSKKNMKKGMTSSPSN